MNPSRIPVLVAVAVLVAGLTWAVLGPAYRTLPPLPWSTVPTLLLLAIGEAYTGLLVRRRIARRPGTQPIDPLAVARLAALAKASAYAAAALAGVFGGFLIFLADHLEARTPRADAVVAGATFGSAVLLLAAALLLEYCCRVPKPPEPRDPSDQSNTSR